MFDIKRIIKFQLVGWLGSVLNLSTLWALHGQLHWSLLTAGAIAIEAAIIHNFSWYYLVTWRDRVQRTLSDYLSNLIRYNLVTASIEFVIKLCLLWALTHYADMHYIIAALLTMLLGPLFKYTANEFYIFRPQNTGGGELPEQQNFMMSPDQKAKRVNRALTHRLEERYLPRMARALPEWVQSGHLTVLGIISSFIIAGSYLLTHYSLWWLMAANAALVVHWYADSLDGTLARVRNKERERYGYYVDHLSDVWTVFIVAMALGMSPLMTMSVAFYIALSYFLMNVYVHVNAYTNRVFLLSYARLGPTEFRLLLIIINTMVIFWNPILFQWNQVPFSAMDIGGLLLGSIFTLTFIYKSLSGASELQRVESQT